MTSQTRILILSQEAERLTTILEDHVPLVPDRVFWVERAADISDIAPQAEGARADGEPHALVLIDSQGVAFPFVIQAIVSLLVADDELHVVVFVDELGMEWKRVVSELPQKGRLLFLPTDADPVVIRQLAAALCDKWHVQALIGAQTELLGPASAELGVPAGVTRLTAAQGSLTDVHSRQLEIIGQLAAGIAHEINTPVQYVSDSAFFLRDALAEMRAVLRGYREIIDQMGDEELVQSADRVAEAADIEFVLEQAPLALERVENGLVRVSNIVGAMREFAPGRTSDEQELTDINQLMESTLAVARGAYRNIANLESDLGELEPVICSGSDLNGVFLNLLVNAVHAIECRMHQDDENGTIRVETRQREGWVEITVADDGCGIPPEIAKRVYDPFFTTKPVGRGTGQGLAIARAIVVEKHGGKLHFESVPNEGTTFIIELPNRPLPQSAVAVEGVQ